MADEPVDLEITEAGPPTGAPVLLIHAFPLDAAMWRNQAPHLNRLGYRTLAVDLPGFGQSPIPADPPTLAAVARDCWRAAEKRNAKRCHIVGCSYGGYVALQMAADAPDRVLSLALVDTRAEPDTPEGKAARRKTIADVHERGAGVVADAMVPKFFTDRTQREKPDLVKETRSTILRAPPAAIAGALETMMERPDQRPRLGAIRCPTLVVVGAEDKVTPLESSRALHQAIPGAHLRIVTGAAHLVPLEAPEPLNHFLEDFLKGSMKPLSIGGPGAGSR